MAILYLKCTQPMYMITHTFRLDCCYVCHTSRL